MHRLHPTLYYEQIIQDNYDERAFNKTYFPFSFARMDEAGNTIKNDGKSFFQNIRNEIKKCENSDFPL